MRSSNILSRFSAVLLDVNSTFMFGEDRYGPQHDYFATYRSLGGRTLVSGEVRDVVDACVRHLESIYSDPARCDSFPQVRDVLAELPVSRALPPTELQLLEAVIASHEVGWIPHEYAEALRSLTRTHQLGVVSNIWSVKDRYLAEFSRVDVLDILNPIVFSSDGPSMKPSRRIFDQALDGLGHPCAEVVFVGDSLRCDVAGAAQVGMATVWINRHDRGSPTKGPRPSWIVRDLLELVPARQVPSASLPNNGLQGTPGCP